MSRGRRLRLEQQLHDAREHDRVPQPTQVAARPERAAPAKERTQVPREERLPQSFVRALRVALGLAAPRRRVGAVGPCEREGRVTQSQR